MGLWEQFSQHFKREVLIFLSKYFPGSFPLFHSYCQPWSSNSHYLTYWSNSFWSWWHNKISLVALKYWPLDWNLRDAHAFILGCALGFQILKVPLVILKCSQGVEEMTNTHKLSSVESVLQTTCLDLAW